MIHTFTPKGVCSKQIQFELDGDVIRNVYFEGGCNGNLQGLSRLVEGRTVSEVSGVLQGIRCDNKLTSCPDQFAQALKEHLQREYQA